MHFDMNLLLLLLRWPKIEFLNEPLILLPARWTRSLNTAAVIAVQTLETKILYIYIYKLI